MAAINIDVGANTRRAERDIQKLVSKSYNINLKTKGDQPLGRITGKVNEFTKSLDASNARVIAFGASAGIIFGVQRAFEALASSVIQTQKSLADINVILNVSSSQLQKFGGELFGIAKNTGQSFQEVAKAATEFSRQGLGITETLKRTNEALILSRLSGLDAAKSVEALTAAVNSFASQAVTATEIVNKFANVDAAFAVSSADLADAISRVGSSAAQSGVNLDELIAIVTAAQQTTARGGAVIGNSFKTIFTRLQRTKVVDLLEGLGVDTKDSSGQIKSTINLLTDLAKVYDQLGTLEQAEVAEKVGGVFQINILKAALADLGKEFSVYNSALQVAGSSTDQAIRRNEELNKTYAAQLNAIQENAKQLGASVGDRLFGPAFNRVVGNANDILGGINAGDGNGIGATLGKGILDGLGQVIAGPGLALLGGIFIKLFADLSKFIGGSLKELLNLNNASKQQQALQQSISAILQKNPDLFKLMQQGTVGLNKGAEILLNSLRAQTVELQKQEAIAAKIAAQFLKSGGVTMVGGIPTATTGKPPKAKSGGFIPNFSVQSELTGIKKSRDYTSSQKRKAAGDIRTANFPGIGPTVFNGQESVVESTKVAEALGYPPGTKPKNPAEKLSILTPTMANNLGFAAKGFIPNFADPNIYKSQKKFAAGKVFDNAIALSLRLKSAYVEDRDIIDFPPNQLSASNIDKRVKEELGINRQTLYGDAKLSDSEGNRASYISKILRLGGKLSGDPKRGYTVTPPGPGGSILVPGSKFADKRQSLRAGVGAIIKKNPSLESYFANMGISKGSSLFLPNVLIDYVSGITGKNVFGAVAGGGKNFNDPNVRASAAQSIASRFRYKASGFIPNFAAKEIINLGDTVTAPELKGKVSSLIHPAITGGLSKENATASYLGRQYRGLVTTAGINKEEIKGDIPDLEKNVGNLLLREANQFGQVIGGQNFLKTPEELPNYGGVKGAVGTAFEGGVTTLLRQGLQKSSQTAGIDFSQQRMTPKMKRLFHGAPGTYEAKYSPALANEVLGKMLKAANVGGVKTVRSGSGFAASQALRAEALKNLEGRNLRRGPQLEKAIKEEMANIARAKGMAAGFIPNFAEEQMAKMIAPTMALENAMAPAGEKAKFYKKPYPHVRYQSTYGEAMADHGGKNQAIKDSLMGQKKAGITKATGFIPNFAVNEGTAATDLSATIAALTTQLGGLAFMLSFNKDQYRKSLSELTQATRQAAKEQLKQSRLEAQRLEQRGLGNFATTAREDASKNFRQQAVPFQSKAQAALGTNALALTFIGPIIAETIANAIGKETKEARVGSAGASAAGQAATFAGFGALLTANPLVGGGIGLAAGAMLGLVDVIKQANTNIPELSEAARKASENLTKINDVGQKVQTQFEQVQQLRESGQGEKAGKLEADLLKLIGKEFRNNPELASEASSAVINQDFVSLQKTIAENTNAILKNTLAKEQELLAGTFAEGFGGKDSLTQFENLIDIGNIPLEGLQKLQNIISQPRNVQTTVNAAGGTAVVSTVDQDVYKVTEQIRSVLNEYSESFASLPTTFQDQIIAAIRGGNIQDVSKFLSDLNSSIKNGISIQEAINRNSAKTNPIIKAITEALSKARSIYSKFATNAQAAVDLQLTGQRAIRQASTNIAASQSQRDVRILTAAGNPAAAENKEIKGALNKIYSDFNNTINASIDSVISNVASAFIQNGQKALASFTEIGGEEGAQSRAAQNIDAAATFAEAFKQQFNINNFKDLIGLGDSTDLENFKGFNVQSVLNEISSKLGISQEDTEGKALLEKIEESLNQANQTLLDQKAKLAEQLTVLANDRFAKNFEELMGAITKSFGGMESFRNFDNQFSLTDELDRAIGAVVGLRNASGPNTDTERARALSSVVEELSKLAGSNIVTDRSGGLRTEVAPIVDAIVQGRAIDIERTINSILSGPLSKTGEGGVLQTAFLNELIENLGIERKKEDGTDKTQQELVREVALKNAEMQTKAELGVGDVNQALLDESFNRLPENLQKIFKEQGMGQFNSIEQIAAAQQIVHTKLLEEIANILKGMSGIESFKGNGFNTNREIGTTFNEDAAGGGGINPVGVGAATDITSDTPANVAKQANYPGQDPVSKSFNEGDGPYQRGRASMLQDVTFKGLDGKDKTISKFPNEQAPFDLTTGLTTKISDLDGVIGSVINPDMIPDNSPENPLLPPKNMIDTGINDAIGSGIDDIVKNNPDLQTAAGLLDSEYRKDFNAQATIDEINDKYFSTSSSSSDSFDSWLEKNYQKYIEDTTKKKKNNAKGYIPKGAVNPLDPGYQTEKSNIRKGVGGAKPWHSPYMTEINGEPAWVHDGEMIVPNMGNTGETGVLTPDMKKALNLAKGYIPNEKELQEALARAAGINSLIQKNLGLGFEKPLGLANEVPDVEFFDPNDPKNKGFRAWTEIYGKKAKVSFKKGERVPIGTLANEATALTQNELPAGVTYNPSQSDETIRQRREMGRAVGVLGKNGALNTRELQSKAENAYIQRLTEYADKLIELNKKSGDQFLKTKQLNLSGAENFDQRALGLNDPKRGFIMSEFSARAIKPTDYAIERLSTLNSLLIEGIKRGYISREDLMLEGFVKDKNEADYLFNEINSISNLIEGTSSSPKPSEKKPLAEQARARREASKAKPSVNMPAIPTALDFANTATRNRQQTQFNRQVTTTQARPTNPFRLIGGKGTAPATQIDTRTGTGTTVPRVEAVNPNRGISTSTGYSQDPEVQKAIKSGDIRAIEQATIKARERAGKSFQTPESDFARKYKFEQDLSKAIGGIATGGTQAEVDAYYKKKAEEAGMSDRFITDYIEPIERDIIKREEQKLNPTKRNFTEKGARSRLKEMIDGYDGLMRGNRSMAQTQAYQAKKQELQRLFNSGNFEGIYNTYDSLPKSDQPRGVRTPDGFIVAPPTPIPEPKYKNAEEARADGRQVLKAAPVGAYTRKDGKTLFNAPYINEEIPRAMAAANEAATMASIKQTLAISDFNRGKGPDPRKMDFTPKVLPPVLDYSGSVSQPGIANYNRAMNLSPINPGGIDLYENLKGAEQPDGSVSTGIPKSWETINKIEEEKKKTKNYAQGLVNRSFLAELANGGVPVQDSIPGIGNVVIDKNQEYSAANAVARKGLSQGMYESRKMQNIPAQSFVPNFAVKKADTQPSSNNFSIKLGDMVINSSAAKNNPELYGKDFGSELQSRIPDVIEQIKSDMDKKYGRVADLVRQNENIFVNKVPPKSRGNAALRT